MSNIKKTLNKRDLNMVDDLQFIIWHLKPLYTN